MVGSWVADSMRTLYFDLDGTVLALNAGEPKVALADGMLETAIRGAGIEELVCVGNFVAVIHTVQEVDPAYDGLGAIFALCRGSFRDESWFRGSVRLARDPQNRARDIAFDCDWWYVDDLAEEYLLRAGMSEVYREERGRRILVPSAEGDGTDVVQWLQRLGIERQP